MQIPKNIAEVEAARIATRAEARQLKKILTVKAHAVDGATKESVKECCDMATTLKNAKQLFMFTGHDIESHKRQILEAEFKLSSASSEKKEDCTKHFAFLKKTLTRLEADHVSSKKKMTELNDEIKKVLTAE